MGFFLLTKIKIIHILIVYMLSDYKISKQIIYDFETLSSIIN